MSEASDRFVIGMDPHKRSVTIEVMTADEAVVGGGRFSTDKAGYRAKRDYVAAWPDRVWAIKGCNGIGRHIAMRLLRDDQAVVDVPPKLSARRAGPQDRRDRRSLRCAGWHPDDRAATGGQQ